MSRIAIVAALMVGAWWVTPATAEPSAEGSIFRRFLEDREPPRRNQRKLDIPFGIRPQTDPDATILENTGVDFSVASRAGSRVYLSQGFGFGRMAWRPRTGKISKVQVIQVDFSQILNVSLWRKAVLSFGLGLGLMDGEIFFKDDRAPQTRLEPFIPLQIGLAAIVGSSLNIGVKLAQSSFFGPGPVISVTRTMAGVAYNF